MPVGAQRKRHHYESLNQRTQPRHGNGTVTRHASQIGFNRIDEMGSFEQSSLRSRLRTWWPFAQHEGSGESGASVPGSLDMPPAEANFGARPASSSHIATTFRTEASSVVIPGGVSSGGMAAMSNPVWTPFAHGGDQRWMPDEKCSVCFSCGATFGTFRWRHHCRLCGQIFCHNCSSHFVAGKLIGRPKEQQSRLCVACTSYCDGLELKGSPPSRGLRSPDAVADGAGATPSSAPDGGMRAQTMLPGQPTSPGRRRHPKIFANTLAAIAPSGEHRGSSSAPREDDGTDSSPIEPRISTATSGDESDHSSPSKPEGEALEGESDEEDSDPEELFPRQATEAAGWQQRHHDPRARSDSMATDSGEELNLAQAWFWTGSEKPPLLVQVTPTELGLPAAATRHLAALSLEVSEAVLGGKEARETAKEQGDAWRQATAASVRHFVRSVRECCIGLGEGLEDPSHISATCRLAQQVVDHFVPCSGDSMDILNYVKIKRIPGGSIADSQWVNGVVFSRDVAHRKMCNSINGCNLALLREPLSFDHDHRLTPLDVLRRQEADYFDLKVEKIADLNPTPQLLMCQGGVSQIAQDKLRAKNISLVLGVPSHILDAVARCTGAKVLQSVDSIVRCTAGGRNPVVGTCRQFVVEHTGETGEEGSKALTVVEGAYQDRYGTVCLRGGGHVASGNSEEAMAYLSCSKRTLQWSIRLARHLQLESELLFEMWCEPWLRDTSALQPMGLVGCKPNDGLDVKANGNAVGPSASASLQRPEFLELTCYSVSKSGDWSCTRPIVLKSPAYALPSLEALTPLQRPSGWAGGLEGGALEGLRDCTLHEWLTRCFEPELSANRPTVCLSTNPDASFVQNEEALATSGSLRYDSGGNVIGADVMDLARNSGGGRWHAVSAATAAAARALVPPVPGKGEVLIYQHRQSRVAVELTENEAFRNRAGSVRAGLGAPTAARTRWAHFGKDDEAMSQGGLDLDPDSGQLPGRPIAGRPGAGPAVGSSAHTNAVGCGEIEVWRWCRCCNKRVTPIAMLSASAGWHSFTKFLELLLHNDTSKCSALAARFTGCRCPHVAFRSHVLFFSSPQRPLVVGFKWEHVQLWKLHPPHLPFWRNGHEPGLSEESLEWEAESPLQTSSASSDCDRLLNVVRALVAILGELIDIVLNALSYHDDESPAHGSGGTMLANRRCASMFLPDVGRMAVDQDASLLVQPPWLQGWVLDNRQMWHRVLRQLSGLHATLQNCVHISDSVLGVGSNKVDDPVIVHSVCRDLLDALTVERSMVPANTTGTGSATMLALTRADSGGGATHAHAASAQQQTQQQPQQPPQQPAGPQAPPPLSLRSVHADLQKLRGLRNAPKNSASGSSGGGGAGASGGTGAVGALAPSNFPVPAAFANLATRTKDLFKGMWVPTDPGSSEGAGGTSSLSPRGMPHMTSIRSRSRSLCRRPTVDSRGRGQVRQAMAKVRSHSMAPIGSSRDDVIWRRCASGDEGSLLDREAALLHSLPIQVQNAMSSLDAACKEDGRSRLASLERGVHGLIMPVNEEDVGSIISHALLHHQYHEQMQPLWSQLTGGRPCCPLAEPLHSATGRFEDWSCFASFPEGLAGAAAARAKQWSACSAGSSCSSTCKPAGATVGPASRVMSHSRQASGATVPAPEPPPCQAKLASIPWKRLPAHVQAEHASLARHPWEAELEQAGLRRILTATTPPQPVRVEFSDQAASYMVSIHHAPQYHVLRHWLCGDDLNFLRSLHKCTGIKPSGGKSGAAFFVSHDRRFLLKAVNKAEFKMMTAQSEALFWYFDQVLFDKLPSVLAQVVGLFTVSVAKRNKSKVRVRNFIVQRNLRYSLQSRHHFCFDLKGVGKSRRAPSVLTPGGAGAGTAGASSASSSGPSGGPAASSTQVPSSADATSAGSGVETADGPESTQEENREVTKPVLWDQNFREWTDGKPLCLLARDLKYLEAAVWNDTTLLSKQSLVDYSLLLAAALPRDEGDGVQAGCSCNGGRACCLQARCRDAGSLSLGIIDYLRPYTWDKHMEKVVKSLAHNSSDKPTVIEPMDYARRFLNAMGTFFVAETPSSPPVPISSLS